MQKKTTHALSLKAHMLSLSLSLSLCVCGDVLLHYSPEQKSSVSRILKLISSPFARSNFSRITAEKQQTKEHFSVCLTG
jgi:hypothetical protein